MKLSTIIQVVIALLIAVGWGITYSSLSSKLEDANEVISIQKQENTALLVANTELESTNTVLRSNLLEVEEAVRKTQEDLRVVNSELILQKEKYSEISKKMEELETEVTSAKAEIKLYKAEIELYKETFGEVYSMPNPPINVYGDSLPRTRLIDLQNIENATNPSWMQLQNFLKTDKTDVRQYIAGYYVCGNYAEDVHNNAEAVGIRAAVVIVSYTEGPGHALNAFKTTDKGLVYIDCTGLEPFESGPHNMDTTVNLKLQGKYYRKFIFPSGWYFTAGTTKVTSIKVYW